MANTESIHAIGSTNTVNYYNSFVKRYDVPSNPVLAGMPDAADSNSLLVIDVQDDFILPPPGLSFLPAGYTYGRFNVEDGANMTKMLGAFIVANMGKFSKVVFSRDTHTVDHCSFGTNAGPFPNHCVANHIGSKFHDDMKLPSIVAANGGKVDVIFKGCTNTTDSFGAVAYPTTTPKDAEYAGRRQLGNCSLDGFTGGKYLSNKSRNFEDFPFTTIPAYPQIDEKQCPESTTAKIAAELGETFKITDLFPGQASGTHNIYVVGVAGDYCVKDTAMNIMNSLGPSKMLNGVKINVYVLQPFVRYGFLPLQFLGGFNNVYKNVAAVVRKNYTNIKDNKDINQYVFKYDGANKKALSRDEVVEKSEYINGIISFKNAFSMIAKNSADPASDALKIAGGSNPEVLCSFLSPVKDIIRDYRESGVKMLVSVPDVFTNILAGGARRNRRSNKRTRNNKRNNRRSRNNRRTRNNRRQ